MLAHLVFDSACKARHSVNRVFCNPSQTSVRCIDFVTKIPLLAAILAP